MVKNNRVTVREIMSCYKIWNNVHIFSTRYLLYRSACNRCLLLLRKFSSSDLNSSKNTQEADTYNWYSACSLIMRILITFLFHNQIIFLVYCFHAVTFYRGTFFVYSSTLPLAMVQNLWKKGVWFNHRKYHWSYLNMHVSPRWTELPLFNIVEDLMLKS